MVADCGRHDESWFKCHLKILLGVAGFLVVVGLVVTLLVFLVFNRGSAPNFSLQDVSVQQFNLSSDGCQLNSAFQVTLLSSNARSRSTAEFSGLSVVVTYRQQVITLPSPVAPFCLPGGGTAVISSFVQGPSFPLAPYLGAALGQEMRALGHVVVEVRVVGTVAWKLSPGLKTRASDVKIICPTVLVIGGSATGGQCCPSSSTNPFQFRQAPSCRVEL